ncbi:MAG: hypothetical protein EBT68_04070 [Verrucomicrobia bacterium]|nr:hypothetical protein [Verrucomicrobiota bacterium]NBR63225.1 hypothetical protein [Verrucomicrobiota bacterium]
MWNFLLSAAWGWLLCATAVAGPEKFAGEVDALTNKPKPAPGHVLLVGSSTIRMWRSAAADLAPLPVENRGFGGSRTEDQLFYFDRLLDGLEPGLVVWYCGSNDVTEKKPVGTILRQTREWLAKFRARYPDVPVLLVKVMRAPQKKREKLLAAVDGVNRGYEEMVRGRSGVQWVDINPPLEVRPGEPREDLYQSDGLHLNERGYAEMVKVLRPRIEELSRAARHP